MSIPDECTGIVARVSAKSNGTRDVDVYGFLADPGRSMSNLDDGVDSCSRSDSPQGTQPEAVSLDTSPSWVRGSSSGRAPRDVPVLFCAYAWIRPSSVGSDGVPSPDVVMWVQV